MAFRLRLAAASAGKRAHAIAHPDAAGIGDADRRLGRGGLPHAITHANAAGIGDGGVGERGAFSHRGAFHEGFRRTWRRRAGTKKNGGPEGTAA